ncbi:MAG: integrase arm-type DNA-binding domain-containing protein [Gammaproteobacteria bacterium]|nr:integrase arm-type DNA-binding domain-containing protein [Gammaproteobacteria bacterium]
MLTDKAIRTAKATERPRKLFDERGLFLVISPSGGRWWRFKYQFQGREKLISLGTYPDTTLQTARKKRDEARRQVAEGIDPSAKRQAEKVAQGNTFEAIALEWLAGREKTLAPATIAQIRKRLSQWIFPKLGRSPMDEIKPDALLRELRKIEARGTHETAHRTRADCGRVFRYAVATSRASRDLTADLRGALTPVQTEHFAAITQPTKVGELLRAIDGYRGQPSTEIALKLAPYVFVRPGELRAAEWAEFDLDAEHPEWRIPAVRMKMDREHVVPLARQVKRLLLELKPLTGSGVLLFPTLRDHTRPMSDNTLNAALRRLGYQTDEMTAHGFRSMASTLLNEQGWHPDLIELQLAHKEKNLSRGAYNRAERLTERRKMMQAWADYLDGLKGRSS